MSRIKNMTFSIASRIKKQTHCSFSFWQLSLISHLVRGNLLCCLSQARSYMYTISITQVLADHFYFPIMIEGFSETINMFCSLPCHLAVIPFWSCLAQLVLRLHLSGIWRKNRSHHRSLHWSMKKTLVGWSILGRLYNPCYIGIMINHYKDPY